MDGYIPKPEMTGYYSPDNGQFVTTGDAARVCHNWKCQRWEGSTPMYPLLVKNERGFNVCPVCTGSFGR